MIPTRSLDSITLWVGIIAGSPVTLRVGITSGLSVTLQVRIFKNQSRVCCNSSHYEAARMYTSISMHIRVVEGRLSFLAVESYSLSQPLSHINQALREITYCNTRVLQ